MGTAFLPQRQKEFVEKCDLIVSEFVRLEIRYLRAIGRIRMKPDRIIANLAAHMEVAVSACPLKVLMDEAMKISWTRDPFDRLIVANAQVEKAMLLTCDEVILKQCHLAVG